MNFTSRELMPLIYVIEGMIFAILVWLHRRRAKRNKELSEILRRRSDESVVIVVGVLIGGEGGNA